MALLGATAAVLAGPALNRVTRSWTHRVAVASGSMEPTLRPGDWLLFDPLAFRRRSARPGEMVVVPDPREPARWLVKRVAFLEPDGRLELRGDRPDASTDSRTFGPIDAATVVGRPWFRYWPPGRVGPIR